MPAATKSRKKKADPKPQLLNVAFIWDMSGSMGSIDVATREGTQGYIMGLQDEEKKLRAEHGEGIYTRFSLTAFDTVFEQWLIDEPVADIDVESVIARYLPRGGTALYDAVANTIADLSASIAARGGSKEKCLVIVMTDGGENSSQEYSLAKQGKERLFKLIKSYEKKGNWTFVYLGAGPEAYQESISMGIAAGNTAYYSASVQSAGYTASAMSNVTTTLRNNLNTNSDTTFADAAETQDMRDEDDKLWTPGK